MILGNKIQMGDKLEFRLFIKSVIVVNIQIHFNRINKTIYIPIRNKTTL